MNLLCNNHIVFGGATTTKSSAMATRFCEIEQRTHHKYSQTFTQETHTRSPRMGTALWMMNDRHWMLSAERSMFEAECGALEAECWCWGLEAG